MKTWIWKKFIKDYENVRDPEVRGRYTKLTGTLGIIVNTVLCVIKIILGAAIGSIAVIADGIHDMADSLAACITLLGAYISRRPADSEHPYGHARAEYLASLAVSAIVLIVGVELMKNSVDKILHPTPTEFSWLMVGFMILAILLKGSQALFTIATGKHIDSLPVIAAGTDNRNDVITSIIIVTGMLIHHFAGLDLDGWMGGLVSLFILWSGITLIKSTVSPILGESPDEDLMNQMEEIIASHPQILGIHDLRVYNYGPGRNFATFHAEVDASSDLLAVHDQIDHIERELSQKLGIEVTGHMDPVVLGIAAEKLGSKAKIEIIEMHSATKRDAPSGTAIELAEEMAERAPDKDLSDIPYHSVRAGNTPSEHRVIFGCMGEKMEISHEAYDWRCYALGACDAAIYMYQKMKTDPSGGIGLYSMDDVIGI